MPSIMSNEPEKDPIFVMNSLSEQNSGAGHYFSSESLEDRHSTTSSTESNPSLNVAHRKDHEFIPTRMKTIAASKPAADPTQFTRVTSNPLLISAQKQLMKVEEVKKKKEIIPKRGDDEPDWQSVSLHLTFLARKLNDVINHTGAETNFLYRNSLEFDIWKVWIL